MRFAATLLIALTLAGCAAGATGPTTAPMTAPDLRGGWTGTWGGTPLSLLITDQSDAAGYSGLYAGPWHIAGPRYPGVTGVMTYTTRGEARTVRFDGWIRSTDPLALTIAAGPLDGPQELRLTAAGADRLEGTGESTFRWGPRGAVELRRTTTR